jgi:hypothetical protein
VSHELAVKIQLGLEELAIVREQLQPLISMSSDAAVGVIETAAACAMLHSFYTEIEKDPQAQCSRVGRRVAFIEFMAQGSAHPNVRGDAQASRSSLSSSGRSPQ